MHRTCYSSGTPWEQMAGYSRAVRVGPHVAVAGTTAADSDGNIQHIGDPAGQARYILQKIAVALHEAGASLEQVIRTRIYLRDIADWEAVMHVHGEIFGSIRPACTLVRAELINPAMRVEIEADAFITE
jgi:enamine deaminase RidA (YjgF/YER057c/UK114 family)